MVDSSFFCLSRAVNPALTIMANALRVGDHLLEKNGWRITTELLRREVSVAPEMALT